MTQGRLIVFTQDRAVSDWWDRLHRVGAYGVFMYNPIAHLPIFLLGMGLGRYKLAFAERRATAWAKVAPHASCLLMLALLACSGRIPHLILHNGLIAIAFSVVVFHVEGLWAPLTRLLSLSAIMLLGEASYALYILQYPLLGLYDILNRHLLHLPGGEGWPLTACLAFLVFACGSAVVTFLTIERPGRKLVRRLLTKLWT